MTLKAGVRISLRAGLFLFTLGAFASEHISLQLVPLRRCGDPFLPDVPHADRLPVVVTERNLVEKKGRVPVLVVERHVIPLPDGREGYITLPPRRVIGPYAWWLGAQHWTSSYRATHILELRAIQLSRQRHLSLVDLRRAGEP